MKSVAQGYYILGSTLAPGKTVKFKNGLSLTQKGCFLKAIDIDPKFSVAFNHLGYILAPGETVQLKDGTLLTWNGKEFI